MITDLWMYPALFGAGLVAGALNVIGGGGSFLTLPLLIFMGLPPSVANATNRVGIFFQNVGAVWGFHRHGVVEWRYLVWAAAPATLGSLMGAWFAVAMSGEDFKRLLAFLMVAVTLWTLVDPLKKVETGGEGRQPNLYMVAVGFFFVGIYGGFVQAGVGFLILAATTMAGLDMVKGNGVKVLTVLIYTFFALCVFIYHDKVRWEPGLALAAGTIVGSQIGVKLTVLKGHRWVKAFVTVMVVVFALKLWFGA